MPVPGNEVLQTAGAVPDAVRGHGPVLPADPRLSAEKRPATPSFKPQAEQHNQHFSAALHERAAAHALPAGQVPELIAKPDLRVLPVPAEQTNRQIITFGGPHHIRGSAG